MPRRRRRYKEGTTTRRGTAGLSRLHSGPHRAASPPSQRHAHRGHDDDAAGVPAGTTAGFPVGPREAEDVAKFGGYPSGAFIDRLWDAFTEGW